MTRENLNGVRVIRAFCREEQSVADFEKSNDELTRLNEIVGKISALLNPLTYVLINIAAVVLIWQAGFRSTSAVCSRDRLSHFTTTCCRSSLS